MENDLLKLTMLRCWSIYEVERGTGWCEDLKLLGLGQYSVLEVGLSFQIGLRCMVKNCKWIPSWTYHSPCFLHTTTSYSSSANWIWMVKNTASISGSWPHRPEGTNFRKKKKKKRKIAFDNWRELTEIWFWCLSGKPITALLILRFHAKDIHRVDLVYSRI